MIMEEAQVEFMGSNDFSLHQHHRRHHHHQIVKGKRTKRQRSSSPYKVVASSSSSSGYGGGGGEGEREVVVVADEFGSVSSPPTSSGGDIYESTEEEEDMANCLILLAQGDRGRSRQINGGGNGKKERLSSARKFSDIATTTNKAGFYVYECKTCNRSFPSFQALGGHRASHKKPKPSPEEKKPDAVPEVTPVALMEDLELCQLNKSNTPDHDDHPVPLQIATATTFPAAAANNSSSSSSNENNNNNNNNSNNKGLHGNKAAKVHECSICGSEFMSGQALGGHMRRHRANATSSTSNNQVVVMGTIDTGAATTIDESNINNGEIKPTRTFLPLDLNLPAPEDDHNHREPSTFQFTATQQQQQQQQQPLVFSAPALVDCHY